MPSHPEKPKASSRFIWPPTIYIAACLAAYGLSQVAKLAFVPAGMGFAAAVAALALLVPAALIAIFAEWKFWRAGTATLPTSPTTALVTRGIYARTCNPMYLAMSLMLAGIGFAANSLWFFVALPAAIYAVTKLAIEPEEAYLSSLFGSEYASYCQRVRRWL